MSIKIVTDSTCDLPASAIAEYGITMIPLYINFGTEGFLDGIELSRQEFYERLPDYDPPQTTAAPGTEVFCRAYDQLAAEGAAKILSIHISPSLSATLNAAQLAAQETQNVAVTAFESGRLSLGLGFIVLTAAEAAAAGCPLNEINDLLLETISRTHVFAALETLEYLRRSGRMNRAVASFGNLLQIKPLLKMHNGNPNAERVRTNNGATKRLIHILSEPAPLERVALVHAGAPDRAEALRQQAKHLLPEGAVSSVEITPVLGANLGPGAVGFACVKARKG